MKNIEIWKLINFKLNRIGITDQNKYFKLLRE